MRTLLRAVAAVIVAVAAAVLSPLAFAPTTAQAADAQPDTLTIGIRYVQRPESVSVTLTCDPVGGTHLYARDACADLASTDGNIKAISPQPLTCGTDIYPVEITAVGTWRGRPVDFIQQQDNFSCGWAAHGHVFWVIKAFWE
jgi:hypothetical protein